MNLTAAALVAIAIAFLLLIIGGCCVDMSDVTSETPSFEADLKRTPRHKRSARKRVLRPHMHRAHRRVA